MSDVGTNIILVYVSTFTPFLHVVKSNNRIVTSITLHIPHKKFKYSNYFMFYDEPSLLHLLGITAFGLQILIPKNPTKHVVSQKLVSFLSYS